MMSNKNEIKSKRILITGITGFIGTHLEKTLQEHGAIVYGLSRSSTKTNIIAGDILDQNIIDRTIQQKKIQCIIHLASESLVESGQDDPYRTFTTNIQGTVNVLEAARKNRLERIIIASTSHVYGKNRVPYYEGYSPRPSRPYETSKTCIDLIAQSYETTFGLPVLIPRFVNVYGPGDMNFTRLIPKTIQSVLHDKQPDLWGGEARRDYLYISDAIEAYVRLLSVPFSRLINNNKIFNFGAGAPVTVKEIVQKIITISGKSITIRRIEDQRTDEIRFQYVSWKKARLLLMWSPEVSLDSGLQKTIAWYKNQILVS